MDLSGLSLTDLRALQEQIKQEIKKREHDDVIKAREQIMAIAQSVGIPLKELMGGQGRAAAAKTSTVVAKVAVRYRHPADASLQWTGRGRQPKWIQEWLTSGQSLDALKV